MAKLWNKNRKDEQLIDWLGTEVIAADFRGTRRQRHLDDSDRKFSHGRKRKVSRPRCKHIDCTVEHDYSFETLGRYFEQLVEAKSEWLRSAECVAYSISIKSIDIFEDEAYATVSITYEDYLDNECIIEEYEFLNEQELIDLGFVW